MKPEKEIDIKGKTFKIKKFTPQIACYWATRLFGDLIAKVNGFSMEKLPELIQEFTHMPRRDYEDFQRDCLRFVYVKFDSGWAPLVNSDGFFTVPEIDSPTVLQLMLHSFLFSIVDFFDPALLEGLVGLVPDSSTQTQTGASDSYTSPSD